MNRNYMTGNLYEKRAAAWLTVQGYEILEQNFRCMFGEIDLIAREKGEIVFAEVKYRSNHMTGAPEEAVTLDKQRHISNTALFYLKMHGKNIFTACRFDVICIDDTGCRLYQNAFEYCGTFQI